MREDELFNQPLVRNRPVQIYQYLCTEIPKDNLPNQSRIKNILSIKEWLFPSKSPTESFPQKNSTTIKI